MIYGYARKSVKVSDLDENSLESQVKALKLNGCEEIIKDSFEGIKADRPKFQELINCMESGDTLVVTKLDKFSRSAFQGCMIIEELINRGIKVNILNMGIIDNTPSSGLIRNVFLAFAIFERDIIVERTQEGKAAAKEKGGFKEGRPMKYADNQINMALDLLKEHSYTEVEKLTKISKATLVRAMRKRKMGQ